MNTTNYTNTTNAYHVVCDDCKKHALHCIQERFSATDDICSILTTISSSEEFNNSNEDDDNFTLFYEWNTVIIMVTREIQHDICFKHCCKPELFSSLCEASSENLLSYAVENDDVELFQFILQTRSYFYTFSFEQEYCTDMDRCSKDDFDNISDFIGETIGEQLFRSILKQCMQEEGNKETKIFAYILDHFSKPSQIEEFFQNLNTDQYFFLEYELLLTNCFIKCFHGNFNYFSEDFTLTSSDDKVVIYKKVHHIIVALVKDSCEEYEWLYKSCAGYIGLQIN